MLPPLVLLLLLLLLVQQLSERLLPPRSAVAATGFFPGYYRDYLSTTWHKSKYSWHLARVLSPGF